jgi:muramidase (phage lysozyme)
MCESRGNYRTNTGNGFYGAYQFTLSSWRSVGGKQPPHVAEPAEQDFRAVRLRWIQGTGAWPVCG